MSEGSSPTLTEDTSKPEGLEAGHITRLQLVSLAISAYAPAVAFGLAPVLFVSSAGNGSWLSALGVMLATVCIGLAVITFARRYIVTGSLYSYICEVFGPWAQYIVAATLLAAYLTMIAVLAFVVGLFSGSFLLSVGVSSASGPGLQTVIYLVAMAIAAVIAYRGVDTSVRVAVALTVLTTPLIVFITFASAAETGVSLPDQFSLEGASPVGMFQAIAAGASLLIGFESSAALAAETRSPKRNVPLAVMSVPFVIGPAFIVATILQVPGLTASSEALAEGVSAPAALASNAGLDPWVATATDGVLAVATYAGLIGFLNYGSRFALALSMDGLLPKRMSVIHRRFHSPSAAVTVLSAIAVAGVVILTWIYQESIYGVFNALATLVVYFWILPYVLISAGAVTIMARERRWKAFWMMLLACSAGSGTFIWSYVNNLVHPPGAPVDAMSYVFPAVTVVGVGLILLARRKRTPAVAHKPIPSTASASSNQ